MARLASSRVRLALWGLVAVAGLTVGWLLQARDRPSPAETLGRGSYSLATTDGQPFTEATLRGGPSAVFFGFTHCPDVCPTTLGDIATWKQALGPEGEPLRVFFVTVDPERDTAEVLGDYLSWAPGVVGVTGSREETDEAIRAFRIFARKVPLGGRDYTMDHSAMVLLFDRDGALFEPIGYQEGTERALATIRRLLAG